MKPSTSLALATSILLAAAVSAACAAETTFVPNSDEPAAATSPTLPPKPSASASASAAPTTAPTTTTSAPAPTTIPTTPAPTTTATTPPAPATPPLLPAGDPAVRKLLTDAGFSLTAMPTTLLGATTTNAKTSAVMKAMSAALGMACTDCHASANGSIDFSTTTAFMNESKKMWSEYTKKIAAADGTAIWCDSCHQGKPTYLQRDATVGAWMKTNFVDGVTRADGTAETCNSCHGTPFAAKFLSTWQ